MCRAGTEDWRLPEEDLKRPGRCWLASVQAVRSNGVAVREDDEEAEPMGEDCMLLGEWGRSAQIHVLQHGT